MNRADEKRAFDAMMDEISDSDDEDLRGGKISVTSKAQGKAPSAAAYGKDYKQNNSARSTPTPPLLPKQYKMSKEEEEIENFGSQTPQDEFQAQAEQLSVTKRWLSRPCSKGDKSSMKCYVERERGFGVQTTYRCYLEGSDGSAPRFMMAAKKKAAKQTSYYLVSLDINPDNDRGSDTVLGKVRGNAIGSKYIIADHGLAPEKTVAPSMLRKEHGVISFEFDSGGPSRIEAWIPAVSSSGVVSVWQPQSDAQSMEAKIDTKEYDNMLYLQNKTPKWDEAHGGHVLNFQGRVTESSVKNFQLCCHELEDPDEVVLQFGRVAKHKFTMDLRYPLSPLQAFSISIACLDGKIADRKGYEYIKKFTGGGGNSGSNSTDANDLPDVNDNGVAKDKTGREQQARGSMTGNASMIGSIREAIPSTQYLRDKITRSFK